MTVSARKDKSDRFLYDTARPASQLSRSLSQAGLSAQKKPAV